MTNHCFPENSRQAILLLLSTSFCSSQAELFLPKWDLIFKAPIAPVEHKAGNLLFALLELLHMRTWIVIGLFLNLVVLSTLGGAAPPKGNSPSSLPKIDADVLPPGHFIGTIVRTPNSNRIFTLKITYPEVRLKPGARMPNLSHAHSQYMNNQYRQMTNLQRQMGQMQHHHVHNMIQMQQMYMQMQMNQQRVLARLQQQQLQEELRLLQQEIKAIQNMYQVVPVTREVDFQADANIKVRIKDLPQQFDEKGKIKKYSPQELSALKGKDKNLIGYESSLEALQPGQVVLVSLHSHKKPNSSTHSAAASKKAKDDDKKADSAIEHKMQVSLIVILKEGDALHSLRP
jgi:hypothetical protein